MVNLFPSSFPHLIDYRLLAHRRDLRHELHWAILYRPHSQEPKSELQCNWAWASFSGAYVFEFRQSSVARRRVFSTTSDREFVRRQIIDLTTTPSSPPRVPYGHGLEDFKGAQPFVEYFNRVQHPKKSISKKQRSLKKRGAPVFRQSESVHFRCDCQHSFHLHSAYFTFTFALLLLIFTLSRLLTCRCLDRCFAQSTL